MTALHLITDENLISARSYGVELDIEEACATLASWMELDDKLFFQTSDLDAILLCHARMFREILLHLWPQAEDPVVMELLASTRLGLDHIETLTARSQRRGVQYASTSLAV